MSNNPDRDLALTRKVLTRIEQADGCTMLAVLECSHEVYGLKPEATEHLCIECHHERYMHKVVQRIPTEHKRASHVTLDCGHQAYVVGSPENDWWACCRKKETRYDAQ